MQDLGPGPEDDVRVTDRGVAGKFTLDHALVDYSRNSEDVAVEPRVGYLTVFFRWSFPSSFEWLLRSMRFGQLM